MLIHQIIIYASAHSKLKLRPTRIREKQMKKQLMYLLTAIVTIGMASCSTGRYVNNSQNVNLSQTQVVLSQANFQVVKHVSVTYVYKNLHNRRFSANQLKESAYAALVKEAKLTGAQTIINVTMEQIQRESHFGYGIFLAPKYEQSILVSGTVIEFLPNGVKPANSAVSESSVVSAGILEVEETDNNSGFVGSVDVQQTTKYLPAVAYRDGASTYALLQARYAKDYPDFWKKVCTVRNRSNISDERRISEFLLSDRENNIFALMEDVKGITKGVDLCRTFLKYAANDDEKNNNAHEIGAIRETDNNNETIGSEEGMQQSTKSLPAVSDKKGASTYALLQARYAKDYPGA